MIHLVGLGRGLDLAVLDSLAASLVRVLGESCHVREDAIDHDFAFDPSRKQYHATAILRHLAAVAGDGRLLGVTGDDLYVPIFTFVFGEAQLAGPAAVVSTFRLREEFYGLPRNPSLEAERLFKEALHELGHTYGLRHCRDWTCAMASAGAVDRLDLKNAAYCGTCRSVIRGGPRW